MSKASNPCALYGMLSPLIEKPDRKRATVDAICFFVSALAAAALFILVMQLNLLGAEKQDYQVDYASCSCDCWDRQFKVIKSRLRSTLQCTDARLSRAIITTLATSLFTFN